MWLLWLFFVIKINCQKWLLFRYCGYFEVYKLPEKGYFFFKNYGYFGFFFVIKINCQKWLLFRYCGYFAGYKLPENGYFFLNCGYLGYFFKTFLFFNFGYFCCFWLPKSRQKWYCFLVFIGYFGNFLITFWRAGRVFVQMLQF